MSVLELQSAGYRLLGYQGFEFTAPHDWQFKKEYGYYFLPCHNICILWVFASLFMCTMAPRTFFLVGSGNVVSEQLGPMWWLAGLCLGKKML